MQQLGVYDTQIVPALQNFLIQYAILADDPAGPVRTEVDSAVRCEPHVLDNGPESAGKLRESIASPAGVENRTEDGRREANESVEIGGAWAPHGGGVGLRRELHAGRGQDAGPGLSSPDHTRESLGAIRLERYRRVEFHRVLADLRGARNAFHHDPAERVYCRVRARQDARYRRFPNRSAVSVPSLSMVCTRRRRRFPIQPRFSSWSTSCIKFNAFATFAVTIDSGISVQISPTIASMGPGESFQFTASVGGTGNTAVVWLVNSIPGGNATVGFICPSSDPASPCTVNSCSGRILFPGGFARRRDRHGAIRRRSDASGIGHCHDRYRWRRLHLRPRIRSSQLSRRKVPCSRTSTLTGTELLLDEQCSRGRCAASGCECDVYWRCGTLVRATIPAARLTQAGDIDIVVQSQDGGNSSGSAEIAR